MRLGRVWGRSDRLGGKNSQGYVVNNQPSFNQRNMILAMVAAAILLFGWDAVMKHYYPNAYKPKPVATAPAGAGNGAGTGAGAGDAGGSLAALPGAGGSGPVAADPSTLKPTREGGLTNVSDQALEARELATVLSPASRVAIAAPGLSGSINLVGGVVDDLTLNRHRATVDKDSGPVRLFSPAGTLAQQFAQAGWVGASAGTALPQGNTVWTVPVGARLTPTTPVTLSWTNPTGQTFTLTYAIDADYMITVTQGLANHGTAPVSVTPFALITRTNRTASLDSWNIHSGPFGAFDGKVAFRPKYKDVQSAGAVANEGSTDWLGFTDIYWMSVLVPDASGTNSDFRALGGGLYRADLIYHPAVVAPGQTLTHTTRLFAGAKESVVLDRYEAGANGAPAIANFGLAIDWGWFRFVEKPIFLLLRALFHAVGNFGVAIILLTAIVRGVMFPVAQRQFQSMAAMRSLQPKMKALQERFKDDKPKLQEETMKLYKEEKVNPLAGCLPVFLQIPIFFALYKVLNVSIEMRHQPFALWIKDLSAPDPLHILNLFGLIPWTPPSLLGLGVLGLLLGITMYFQFKLQPAQADPAQQQMMSIMPWMMMFVMSPFASGLLIYWITSNCLTMAQQAFLYSRHPQLRAAAGKDVAKSAGPQGKA